MKNNRNYMKLIGIKFLKGLRFALTGTCVGLIIYFLITSGYRFIKSQDFPDVMQIIVFVVSLGIFTTSSTMHDILDQKEVECLESIARAKEFNRQKADLEYESQLQIIEKEIKENSFSAEEEFRVMRKFEVQKITKQDAKKINTLIGLNSVKDQLDAFNATVEYENQHGGRNSTLSYHARFIGNPGTGKTTVAKIMASILYTQGIIEKPHYVTVTGGDCLGKYMGQTPSVINALFKQAQGGLLFIDEAYAMVNSASQDGNGYGYEAITQLLTHLESEENKTVVIFGGYKDDIERLFDMNQGIRSRVPLTFEFPDYSSTELLQILELNLQEMGHQIATDTKSILLEIFTKKKHACLLNQTPFGNARYARTIANALHRSHALNYKRNNAIGTIITLDDIDADSLLQLN